MNRFLGWVDDSIFIRRSGQDEEMASNSVNPGAFTTGRRGRGPPPVKPRSQVRNATYTNVK